MLEPNLGSVYPWNKPLWHQLLNNQQLPQAILLVGREGVGKRQFATQFASHILDGGDVFNNGNHPDFHVIKAENELEEGHLLSSYAQRYIPPAKGSAKPKGVITVQQIRDLIHQANQHAQMSEYKVILVDSADKMNVNAANALLKTLEEPTSTTIFLLVTDQLHRIPVTIRSRCVMHKVRAPNFEFGMEWLNQQSDNTHLEAYLSMAAGAPLSALKMAEDDYITQVRDVFTQLNLMWSKKQTVLQTAKKWGEQPIEQVVDCLQKLLFDTSRLLDVERLAESGKEMPVGSLYFPAQKEWVKKIVKRMDKTVLFNLIDEVAERKKVINTPVDTTLSLEMLAINFDNLV